LLDIGKYAEADAVYQELATRQVVTGRLGRAEALLGLGRVQDAAVQLSGISEVQRALPAVREVEARVLLASGKPGETVAVLRPLLQGDDVRASALVLQGAALYAIDEVDSAAGAYEAALERDKALPEALLGRAAVHLRAERAKDALELLDRAAEALQVRLRPPALHARLLTLRGHAYVQRGKREDLEQAKEALRRAVQVPEAPAEAHFWLGEALGGRKTPEAASALKRYLELAPEGPYAARAKRALGPLL
jgi:tetratricopeptide (TPR) repeat protein